MIEIIVNSNNKNSVKKLKELEQALKEKDIKYEVLQTTGTVNATRLMDEVSSDEIIVIGGDGTMNEVINNYHGEKILYIARGSGNDLGRSLNLKKNTSEIIELINSQGNTEEYDAACVNDRKFCTGLDIGFNADIIERVKKTKLKKYFRKNIYLLCGLASIFNLKKYYAKIEYDNKVLESRKLYLLNVMVQPYEGGGVKFSNTASGKDGLLHIMVMEEMGFFKFVYNYLCLLLKKHNKLKGVKFITTNKLSVTTNQKYYQIDGELVDYKDKLEIKCLEKFYKIKR
ncbi:diacylglycerol/lipid kinase family protein [Gemella cuniculi]|uniref:diacylglycerol/lipid kinase family protein n=1 Tax=Gemella cuniculi TaxID=150240 RepID=UPI0003FA52DA|nr:diacylglycerol kinase family protein [Gemella cuniculi]